MESKPLKASYTRPDDVSIGEDVPELRGRVPVPELAGEAGFCKEGGGMAGLTNLS